MIYLPEHSPVGFIGKGKKVTIPKGTAGNIDFTEASAYLIKGGILYVKGSAWGDKINAYVGLFDPQENFIPLVQWIEDFYLGAPDGSGIPPALDLEADVLGEIYANLVLRIVYHSVGTISDPEAALNFKRYRRL